MNKTNILILLVIMAAFLLIIWATDLVGVTFGKTGDTIALVIVAIILLIGFFKAKGDK